MAIICSSNFVLTDSCFEKVSDEVRTEPNQSRTLRDLIQLSLSTGIPHVTRMGDKYIDENNINWNDPTCNPNYGLMEVKQTTDNIAYEAKLASSRFYGGVESEHSSDQPAPVDATGSPET